MRDDTNISYDISQILADNTITSIAFDLNNYSKNINTALDQLKSWNSSLNSAEKEYWLKDAYTKIMDFRNYLLGNNNTIFYRLYIRDKGAGDDLKATIVTLNEQQLMDLVNRDRSSLRLKQNLEAAITEETQDLKRQAIFKMHIDNIQNGFEHPSNSPQHFVVTNKVRQKYAKNLQFLNNIAFLNSDNTIRRLKLFNRGWIYQAFDATVEAFDQKEDLMTVSKPRFHRKYFTEELKFDNTVGFKGGDVGLAQIKANMAALMSRKTLIKYLTIIKDALEQKKQGEKVSAEVLTDYLLSQFKENNIDEELKNNVIEKVDKLFKASLTN